MKTPSICLLVLCFGFYAAPAQDSKDAGEAKATNLLKNPGFEEVIDVDLKKEYPELLAAGVSLPTGNPVVMPVGVWLNHSDGWTVEGKGQGSRFEYVEGKPGAEVQTGKRAVKIVSPTYHAALIVGESLSAHSFQNRLPVSDTVGLDERLVLRNKPYRFSFFAKGNGSVVVTCYCYDAKGANIYGPPSPRVVEPPLIAITAGERWVKSEGTLRVTNAETSSIFFVIAVQGEVSLDDVVLLRQ